MNSKQIALMLGRSDEAIRQWANNPNIERFLSESATRQGARRRYTEDDAGVLSLVAARRDVDLTFEEIGAELDQLQRLGQWPPTFARSGQDAPEPEDEDEEGDNLLLPPARVLYQQLVDTRERSAHERGQILGKLGEVEQERDRLRGELTTEREARLQAERAASEAQGVLKGMEQARASLHEQSAPQQPVEQRATVVPEEPKRGWWDRLRGKL